MYSEQSSMQSSMVGKKKCIEDYIDVNVPGKNTPELGKVNTILDIYIQYSYVYLDYNK